jgi:hypothetical protein
MITLSMISLLVGAALGQRFKVMVLMPVIAIALVLVVATGVLLAQTAWAIVLMAGVAATCLQIGYFVGIAIHHVVSAALSQSSSPLTAPKATARHAAR